MESWAIFKHAVRMVFGNLGDAIKVTGVLYVAANAMPFIFLGTHMFGQKGMEQQLMGGSVQWVPIVLLSMVFLLLFIWMVVGWHRYVLLSETPSILPKFRGREILAYLGKSILMGLALIPIGILVVFFATLVNGTFGAIFGALFDTSNNGGLIFAPLLVLGGLIIYIPLILVGYRLSPIFPAAALGRSMTMAAAWDAMTDKNDVLFGLALFSLVASFLFSIPTFFLAPASIVAQVYDFVFGWVQMVVGASIVTTLYGHFVEGRPLDLA